MLPALGSDHMPEDVDRSVAQEGPGPCAAVTGRVFKGDGRIVPGLH